MGVTPSLGPAEEYLIVNDLIRPTLQETEDLVLCEEKPEVLFQIQKKVPMKQNRFVDPLFADFLSTHRQYDDLVEWDHSACTDTAYQKAVAKYCRAFPDFVRDEDWKLAETWMHRKFASVCGGSQVTPVNCVLRDMTKGTSPGPLPRYEFDTGDVFLNSELGLEWLNDFLSRSGEPGGAASYAGFHLKDELRLNRKVESESTRGFINMSREHFVLSQQLCSDFNEKMQKGCGMAGFPSALGLNIFRGGFDKVWKRVSVHPNILCDDIEGWDTSIFDEQLEDVAWLRYCCLQRSERTMENLIRFANCYRDIICTLVVLRDGTVIRLRHQPSGQGSTAHDNTIMHYQVKAWIWLKSGGPRCWETFEANVELCLFGDDSLTGVSDFGIRFLNPENIQRVLSTIGWKAEFSPHAEFLGHFFSFDERVGAMVPVFPKHKIISSLARNGKGYSVESLVAKAMSLRIMAWTNKEAFPLVDSYCEWLLAKLDPEGILKLRSQMMTEHQLCEFHRRPVNQGTPADKSSSQ